MINDKYIPNVTGFHLGKVLRHEAYGRCKIWIPGIHADNQQDKPDELPDAIQVSTLFGGGFAGNGMFSYPNLNSVVVCFFINNDQNYPAYLGVLLDGESTAYKMWNDIIPNYGKNGSAEERKSQIHKINSGHSIIQINEDGQISIQTSIRKDGQLQNVNNSKDDYESFANITISKEGDIYIKSSSSINMEAPTIIMNANKQIQIRTPNYTSTNLIYGVNSPQIRLNAGSDGRIAMTSKLSKGLGCQL